MSVRRVRSRRSGVATLLVLLAFACERDIAESDLAGTWTLTRESRERLPGELRSQKGSFVLDRNGTFMAIEVPGEIFGQGPRLITGTGRWLMTERGLRLDLVATANGDPGKVPFSTHFRTSGATLRYFIGDPDAFNTIDFHKAQ